VALALAAFFQITLVIILGQVKISGRHNRGRDRAREFTGLFQLHFGFAGDLFLGGIGEKDRAPILGANVRALPIERGRIVVVPENFKELRVGHLGGVVSDADGFGVAGAIGADVPVGRILGRAADIADGGDNDAGGLPEGLFDTPETAGGKDGGLGGGKFQRDGVQAIPVAGWFGAVGENVTEVGVAAGAQHLNAIHAVAVVGDCGDVVGVNRLEETRPAGAGVKLGSGTEQRQATTDARVDTGLVVVVKCPAEGRLGPFAAGDCILFRGEKFAPFGVGFDDFLHGSGAGGAQGEKADGNQNGMFHSRKMPQAGAVCNRSLGGFELRGRRDLLAMGQEEDPADETPNQCRQIAEQ